MRWFLPKNNDFVALFDQASENIVTGVAMFRDLVADGTGLKAKVENLKEVEHEGDRITHRTLAKLNTSFITPFDREDIHALITRMDDIIDSVDAAAHRMLIYRITEVPPRVAVLGDLLGKQAAEVRKAVVALHDRKRHKEALAACVEINRLENEADAVHREALGELFANGLEPVLLIKLKELYTILEEATDRCEDVANVIESIIIKSS